MRLYHGSCADFDRFTLDCAARPGMAGNGHLGVWMACSKALAARFGDKCYVCEVKIESIFRMTVESLSALHRQSGETAPNILYDNTTESMSLLRLHEAAFYIEQRENLLQKGFDAVEIIEGNGRSEMYVILDPALVTIERVIRSSEIEQILGFSGNSC